MSKTRFGKFLVRALSAWMILGYGFIVHAGSPSWKNVGKACLPEQGRMLTSQTAACHCPPENLCPKNISEWTSHPRQPGFISSICCPRPKTCDLNFTRQGGCGGGSFSMQPQELCLQYDYDETFATSAGELNNMLKIRDNANVCLEHKRNELVSLVERSSTNEGAWNNWRRGYAACLAPLKGNKGFVCVDDATVNVCTTVVAGNCGTSGDCVAADSLVTLPGGATRSISDIKVGDVVKGLTANNIVLGISRIEKTGSSVSLINGDAGLMISAGHPLLTSEGWKAISPSHVEASESSTSLDIKTLEVGDILIGDGDHQEVVKTITVPKGKMQELYNIAVDGDHTFIVNGIIVRGYKNTIEY